MSGPCPPGQIADSERTAFGQCLDAARTLDPTRPVPSRTETGEGFSTTIGSPSPCSSVQREVWKILLSGLHSLSLNDYGRPWPYPVRSRIAELVAEFDADLCLKAARETKEIVQSQDRAPRITSLYEKKLRDLAEVRSAVRASVGEAA